jgi:dTDP-glucose pyrophosphorylase
MKAVILAGGLGTRISEETYLKPKPYLVDAATPSHTPQVRVEGDGIHAQRS